MIILIHKELGGNLDHDHPAWLEHCAEVSTKRNGEVVTMSSSQPSTPVRSHPTLEQLESLPVIICSNGNGDSLGEGKHYFCSYCKSFSLAFQHKKSPFFQLRFSTRFCSQICSR